MYACTHESDFFQTIVSWIGSQANIFEKQKVREIAAFIRDTDRHGKAQITNISEGEETPEMLQVIDLYFTWFFLISFSWISIFMANRYIENIDTLFTLFTHGVIIYDVN